MFCLAAFLEWINEVLIIVVIIITKAEFIKLGSDESMMGELYLGNTCFYLTMYIKDEQIITRYLWKRHLQ